MEHGLRTLLPRNVEVRSGPGCPVCVTSPDEIATAIELSKRRDTVLTTFGDMLRVPSALGSLSDARADGGRIRVVYSIRDAVELARQNPSRQHIHFAIGFETTAPGTAIELMGDPPENFSVIVSHRLIPPAMEHLLKAGEIRIDGFLCPGHVSTIIGVEPYVPLTTQYGIPQVIAGFEPIDVLISIVMILEQIDLGEAQVVNEYTRSVRHAGNVKAKEALRKIFEVVDTDWRGIGSIEKSGYALRNDYSEHDAIAKFGLRQRRTYEMPAGCRCGELLRGLIYPEECPLFGKACTFGDPVGPCMVSREGACYVAARFGKSS